MKLLLLVSRGDGRRPRGSGRGGDVAGGDRKRDGTTTIVLRIPPVAGIAVKTNRRAGSKTKSSCTPLHQLVDLICRLELFHRLRFTVGICRFAR